MYMSQYIACSLERGMQRKRTAFTAVLFAYVFEQSILLFGFLLIVEENFTFILFGVVDGEVIFRFGFRFCS